MAPIHSEVNRLGHPDRRAAIHRQHPCRWLRQLHTSPISIGTTVPHGLSTGQKVFNDGVRGNTAANGAFTITVTDSTHFTLNGSSGNGTYTGGSAVTGGGMAFYDADTAAAAATAPGRALATFFYPNDNPSANSYADANFLRGLIYAHASAIATYVKATYPTAQFEVLWPYDVNHPAPAALAKLGGQLNRYVNLPSQWQTLSGSGLNRMKMESLAFGSTERSLTLAKQAIAFPITAPLTWPLADTAYLIPIFNGGCAWPLEFLTALGTRTQCMRSVIAKPLSNEASKFASPGPVRIPRPALP